MPLNKKMMESMQKEYGKRKGKKVAFAVEALQRKKGKKKSKKC